jgi:hypothetical protein
MLCSIAQPASDLVMNCGMAEDDRRLRANSLDFHFLNYSSCNLVFLSPEPLEPINRLHGARFSLLRF